MQELLKSVVDLAVQAGAMIRAEFYLAGGPRGGGDKADIDVEVEAFLGPKLLALLPGSTVLGEELGSQGGAHGDYCWLVDPHDGTSAFLRGFRGSSVSIGLVHLGKPVLGVVYAPLYPNDDGDLIYGGPGLGLWRDGDPVINAAATQPLGPLDIIALSQDADRRPDANIAAVAPARYLAMPSIAYRLALAAVGDCRVGKSLVYLAAHDVAAGHALLLAAGLDLHAWETVPSQALTYSPHVRSVPMVGGDAAAVATLRDRDPRAVLAASQVSALSPHPHDRSWQRAGLSLQRAQGCLLGQLAGDSLGSLVEFKSATAINSLYPDAGPCQLADGGTWRTLAGQPTDDSEMALALARQLVQDHGFKSDHVMKAYQDWRESHPFDIGGTTTRALKGDPNSESQANGSLMRCSPLGLAFSPDQLNAIARQDSALTHPHPLCGECCRLFTQTISHAIAGKSVKEALEIALASAEGEARELLETSLEAPPDNFHNNMGWVKIAFGNAFHLLARERPLEDALIWTVRQGGDTDTNAAIAGALLGAFQGLRAIPRQWRLAVLTCRPAKSNKNSHQPRPRQYWPVDALNLAELLLELRCSLPPSTVPT